MIKVTPAHLVFDLPLDATLTRKYEEASRRFEDTNELDSRLQVGLYTELKMLLDGIIKREKVQ